MFYPPQNVGDSISLPWLFQIFKLYLELRQSKTDMERCSDTSNTDFLFIAHIGNNLQGEGGFHPPQNKIKIFRLVYHFKMSPDFMTFPKYVLGTPW